MSEYGTGLRAMLRSLDGQTLTDFLLARIAEDEAVAQGALASSFTYASTSFMDRFCDPARVLAECEAKRRIVDEAAKFLPIASERGTQQRGFDNAYLAVARALATVYSDHPDYKEAWRP